MWNKNLALIALVVFAAGCGLENRTYVMTKDRVGLDRGNGNGGCLTGNCPQVTPKETTRKVYVWEITKPVPESEVQKIETSAVNAIVPDNTSADTSVPAATPAVENAQPAAPNVPVVGEMPGQAPVSPAITADQTGNGGVVSAGGSTYTVQKDDTLQKISKKVFGTYGKWYKIYEANKDRIKNPNVLKPGTVLVIPSLEKGK